MSSFEDYKIFVGPLIIEKAVNALRGMVLGIKADNVIKPKEIEELLNWCSLYIPYKDKHPFNEIMPAIHKALSDNILTDEEIQDILWLCEHAYADTDKYTWIAAKMQELFGIFHGLLSDAQLNDKEIYALSEWINDNEELKGVYPFDEVDSLITSILSDGEITEDERDQLFSFLGEFVDTTGSLNLDYQQIKELQQKYKITGICSVCPQITVPGKLFCFTGESTHGPRSYIEKVIISNGGSFINNVTKDTKYLIVGAKGNQCWAFSCYGRKVEKAMEYRKKGTGIVIVHENDFWDSDIDVSNL